MLGDANDMLARLDALLPTDWFADQSPVLDTLLASFADSDAWIYQLIQYAKKQTRLETAQDIWLDGIANDYFGPRISRNSGQGDDTFRQRIGIEVLRERVTRPAMIAALSDLTGYAPKIFLPSNAADTGGISEVGATVSYGMGIGSGATPAYGLIGSIAYPFQFFITAYRPPAVAGGAGLMGIYYNDGGPVYGGIGSRADKGKSVGNFEIMSLSLNNGRISDVDINLLINKIRPINSIPWVMIKSAVGQQQIGTGYLYLNGIPLLLNGIPLVLTNAINGSTLLLGGSPLIINDTLANVPLVLSAADTASTGSSSSATPTT